MTAINTKNITATAAVAAASGAINSVDVWGD